MLYSDAENFAENIVFARRSIASAVDSARLQQKADRLEFDYKMGRDPTGSAVERRAQTQPLAVVRYIYFGEAFVLYQPELWLDVIQQSFNLYRQRFGDKAYAVIKNRFILNKSATGSAVRAGVSMQMYALRRRDYLSGLLILAAQNGLVRIDPTLPPKEDNKK